MDDNNNQPDGGTANPNPDDSNNNPITPDGNDGDDGKKKLTPRDPGHPDYDPLKDPRVRNRTDSLYSALAKEQQEKDDLKKQIADLSGKIKAITDKDKSDKDRADEKIVELEKERTNLNTSLSQREAEFNDTVTMLNAKLLVQQAVLDAGVQVNKNELRGLLGEVVDSIKAKKAGESDDDIVSDLVSDFVKTKGAAPAPKTKVNEPSSNTRANNDAANTDKIKKLRELTKDPEKNEKEIVKLMKEIEAEQMKQQRKR